MLSITHNLNSPVRLLRDSQVIHSFFLSKEHLLDSTINIYKKNKGPQKKINIIIFFLCFLLAAFVNYAESEISPETYAETLRVGVVGDTGIGERAYHAGFTAVAKALKNERPDLLLHLGDFIYQPKIDKNECFFAKK